MFNIDALLPDDFRHSIKWALANNDEAAIGNVVRRLLVQEDDVRNMGLHAFFALAQKGGNDEAEMQAGRILLEEDQAEMVQKWADWQYVDEWCSGHVSTMVAQCPKVFDLWTQSEPIVVKALSKALLKELPSDEQRLGFLLGTNVTGKVAERLRELVKENPKHWLSLPLEWFGKSSSPLREAAYGLGLTQAMVHNKLMQDTSFVASLDKWMGMVDYAFSIGALLRLMQERRPGGIEASKRACENMLGYGKSEMHFEQHADPVDVALGCMICAHLEFNIFFRSKHPQAPDVPPQTRKELQEMLGLHLSLDCLPVLLDKLVDGNLTPTLDQVLLPELNESEEHNEGGMEP